MTNTQLGWIGMVYLMTNASTGNEIIAYGRNGNGNLTPLLSYRTGGNGTGVQKADPLSSQGSIVLSKDGRFLFAVNAGSGDISSFVISPNGMLTLKNTIPSGGIMPNSLAVSGNLLYVSNSGNSDNVCSSNVSGFLISNDGSLNWIPGATYPLSTIDAHPACLVFSPIGNHLVVSELSTNKLSVFGVNRNGTLTSSTVNNSNGPGPFGSAFLSNGTLLNTEAGANALSSYTYSRDGMLTVISGSVINGQSATCWVSISPDEKYAYTSNAGSDTITSYHISPDGILNVVGNITTTPANSSAPIDSGISRDGKNFYVLNGNRGVISVFRIFPNGRLIRSQILEDTGLPRVGAQGLAVL